MEEEKSAGSGELETNSADGETEEDESSNRTVVSPTDNLLSAEVGTWFDGFLSDDVFGIEVVFCKNSDLCCNNF